MNDIPEWVQLTVTTVVSTGLAIIGWLVATHQNRKLQKEHFRTDIMLQTADKIISDLVSIDRSVRNLELTLAIFEQPLENRKYSPAVKVVSHLSEELMQKIPQLELYLQSRKFLLDGIREEIVNFIQTIKWINKSIEDFLFQDSPFDPVKAKGQYNKVITDLQEFSVKVVGFEILLKEQVQKTLK